MGRLDGWDLPALLVEFLEAFVHQALHARRLYDDRAFERRRLYGAFVHKSRHPGLNDYVRDAVASLKGAIAKEALLQLSVVFFARDGEAVEKVTVNLKRVRLGTLDANSLKDLESGFRNALLKLSFVDALIEPLPPGCTFEIVASTSARDDLPRETWANEVAADVSVAQPATCTPLKTLDLKNCLTLHLSVMECALGKRGKRGSLGSLSRDFDLMDDQRGVESDHC